MGSGRGLQRRIPRPLQWPTTAKFWQEISDSRSMFFRKKFKKNFKNHY